ncbi:carbon starvation protein CstA [Thermocrinis albus DSM 14484]|uniref:Carbon starvation protein CstA n=1 Tax=Thermocrinis albus (strain DSM 14484 / JCM 11386 / HI 11/12) TaxID=638303 RepID=D3SLN0_THEAH|nr:carbon starvation CstA family protein [Thermocrinis albus]ADC89660.1 carbon starvation protein CstA [Thermocrinis albus DSM 14484]
MRWKDHLLLLTLALLAALSFYTLALHKGERPGAIWVVLAALSLYTLGYRYYSWFIAYRVLGVDDSNPTPAHRYYNGVDYVPTNRWVLFGHHFASISGAGPLVGPVLAAQMGYLPSVLWIPIGAVIAGAVQDMTVLFVSTRMKGRSLGSIARELLGPKGGFLVLVVIYSILVLLLAVLALVVVKALAESPWSSFSTFMTIPIALLMGIYMWYIRPGDVVTASVIGVTLLLLSLVGGYWIYKHPLLSQMFYFSEVQLSFAIMIYGFFASVLPVWLLLVPRDYLSTFMKLGTVIFLALVVILVNPTVKMPPLTQYAYTGIGPVWQGSLFPFLMITIACGAVSGFHSLVSSGTTPKLLDKESHVRLVGYGGMLGESLVATVALVAAVSMEPGLYFAINSPASLIGKTVEEASKVITSWGFPISPDYLRYVTQLVGEETILSRTGGAPAFALGMALVLARITGEHLLAFWYHFAVLFEAIFILTTIDAGTRIGRYILHDLLGVAIPFFRDYSNKLGNVITSFITVSLWGYLLYAGVVDPYGGIRSLWPLFGISNQLLATVALSIVTLYLVKNNRHRYAWVTGVPAILMAINTLSAGLIKVFHPNEKIGFLAHATTLREAVLSGLLPPGIKSVSVAHRVIFNDYLNAFLAFSYVLLVGLVILLIVKHVIRSWPRSS